MSLRTREQPSMFEVPMNREGWIRHLFSSQVEFTHHGATFVYIPLDPKTTFPNIVGKIGRQTLEIANRPPHEGYAEYLLEAWKAAVLVVDPTEHADGQKLALQQHGDVGKPSSLAPRLLKALEANQEWVQFLASVHPITNAEAFWDWVKKNEGKITKIRIELEVPNMFGGDDEYDREMKQFREREKAQRVAIEVENPDGINAETDRIRYTADKAMAKGTGRIKAKAKGKNNNFTSQSQQESVKIPKTDERGDGPLTIAKSMANKLLGRE
ncbi:hypothetical protein G3572_03325 [Rhodobacter sp. ETT8]|uniref:Uncharacterized protein n=1 Tax=Pseudotabrizicola algicola TaxID=2709381 RepID=A0A6B3RJD2_9RHOB|nr:hypothetical protein [Pseudotabrizicola algicola]